MAAGVVYADTVVVGGVTATSQAVEAATSVSSYFQSATQFDGILGLGFAPGNFVRPQKQKPFFDTIRNTLPSPLFTVTLKKGQAGTFDFGYIDKSKYTGPIVYADTNAAWRTGVGYWGLAVDGVSTSGGSTIMTTFNAVVDTGSPLLTLPDAVVQSYFANIPGAHYDASWTTYLFPCNATLPDLNIIISGQSLTVPASYIIWSTDDPPNVANNCVSGLQPTMGGTAVIGDVFLKSKFAVFDYSTAIPRIGFANQA